MKTRWKVLSGLALMTLALGIWAWFGAPQWVEQFNDRQREARTSFQAQGRLFGQSADQQACLTRSLADFNNGCMGYDCTLEQDYFLKACLEVAAPTPGFCDAVPAYRNRATEDDKSWAKFTCWENDIRGEGCRLLLRQQQYWCSDGIAADAAAQ